LPLRRDLRVVNRIAPLPARAGNRYASPPPCSFNVTLLFQCHANLFFDTTFIFAAISLLRSFRRSALDSRSALDPANPHANAKPLRSHWHRVTRNQHQLNNLTYRTSRNNG
jgi:hypothetical protein